MGKMSSDGDFNSPHRMAVSEDVRVVYPEEDPVNNPMRDVPMDGKTIGEVSSL
jgi:hypothetical protein